MRVTDRVSLHLIYRHLSYIAMNESDEAVTLTVKDLNICNLSEALEERLELVLSYVTRKTADKDSRVV